MFGRGQEGGAARKIEPTPKKQEDLRELPEYSVEPKESTAKDKWEALNPEIKQQIESLTSLEEEIADLEAVLNRFTRFINKAYRKLGVEIKNLQKDIDPAHLALYHNKQSEFGDTAEEFFAAGDAQAETESQSKETLIDQYVSLQMESDKLYRDPRGEESIKRARMDEIYEEMKPLAKKLEDYGIDVEASSKSDVFAKSSKARMQRRVDEKLPGMPLIHDAKIDASPSELNSINEELSSEPVKEEIGLGDTAEEFFAAGDAQAETESQSKEALIDQYVSLQMESDKLYRDPRGEESIKRARMDEIYEEMKPLAKKLEDYGIDVEASSKSDVFAKSSKARMQRRVDEKLPGMPLIHDAKIDASPSELNSIEELRPVQEGDIVRVMSNEGEIEAKVVEIYDNVPGKPKEFSLIKNREKSLDEVEVIKADKTTVFTNNDILDNLTAQTE